MRRSWFSKSRSGVRIRSRHAKSSESLNIPAVAHEYFLPLANSFEMPRSRVSDIDFAEPYSRVDDFTLPTGKQIAARQLHPVANPKHWNS